MQLIIIALVIIVYGNAIDNEHALDDRIFLEKEYIQNGLKDAGKIFTTHYSHRTDEPFDYRPITSLSLAAEAQLIKSKPLEQTEDEKAKKNLITQANIRHFTNVLLYLLTCLLLFQVLTRLFGKENFWLAALSTLIFVVHPMHTEVVANIKSRDEILAFLFMILALQSALNWLDNRKWHSILFMIIFSTLAMLSKKTIIVFIGILPLVLYYKRVKLKEILLVMSPVVFGLASFFIIKKSLVSKAAIRPFFYLENPQFIDHSWELRITQSFYTLWFYVKSIFVPVKMGFYYGHAFIPYTSWQIPEVWLGVICFVVILLVLFIELRKRSWLGFGVALWFGVTFSYLNFITPAVGIVADRFTYVSSLGFAIVLVILIFKIFKIPTEAQRLPKSALAIILGVIFLYSVRTITRNQDWENSQTLYAADIDYLSESAKANELYANSLYEKAKSAKTRNQKSSSEMKSAELMIYHWKKSLEIDSSNSLCYNNIAAVYLNFLNDYDNAERYLKTTLALDSSELDVYNNLAFVYAKKGELDKSLDLIFKSLEIKGEQPKLLTGMEKLLVSSDKIKFGVEQLEKILSEKGDNELILYSLHNLALHQKNDQLALEYLLRAQRVNPTNKQVCGQIMNLYNRLGQTPDQKVVEICR